VLVCHLVACCNPPSTRPLQYTHINGDMAHHRSMVRQSDIMRIMLVVFALRCSRLLLVDDESPLNVDADIAGMLYRLLDIALHRRRPRTPKLRSRRCLVRMRTRSVVAGFTRRGVQCGRHGCACSRSWLQPRSLAAMAHARGSSSGDGVVMG
jgi:hypothetical protein